MEVKSDVVNLNADVAALHITPCAALEDPAGMREGAALVDAWASAFDMAHEICERIRQRKAARKESKQIPAGRELKVEGGPQ